MIRRFSSLLALLLPALAGFSSTPQASVDQRVRELLARMTLEEKVGQLVQYSAREGLTGPGSMPALAPLIKSGGVGSLLNVTGAAEAREWQRLAVESSPLHIPLLFGLDVIHGYRTIFPIPLGGAASWDLGAIERAERVAATEAAAAGVDWTFAPMVDIARDPRWGRIAEGAGEDPCLGSAVARARVLGFQGGDLASPDAVLACAKHFAAYGAAQAGREYYTTDVPERTLRDVYLPPFHAAVEAGVGTLMAAFNDLNGVPASANPFLLDRVLRREWNFGGFVVSDWDSIGELRQHGVAADLEEAARKAFLAGVDMDMQSDAYGAHLADLVRSGSVPESRLDESVGRVLAAKFELGLFDHPYLRCDEAREKAELLAPAHLAAARALARESCVLLKNDGVLPLKTSGVTVALIGPLGDAPVAQLGSWHCKGDPQDTFTVRAALAEIYPGGRLRYARGCDIQGGDRSGFEAAREAAAGADVIVAAVGEADWQSGEAGSRACIDLPGPQAALLEELHSTGKPLVLLLMAGRPLTIANVEPYADAILMAWHPGTMGGPAVADVLTGTCDASGHLPVTWPRSVGQIPIFYDHMSSGRPRPANGNPKDRYYSHYLDEPNSPLYPFGYGLSYTTFAFDKLRLSASELRPDGRPLEVTVRVRNIGKRSGEDVVQLYVHDRVASVTRPVRELKGFARVALAPGEERDVSFRLSPADLAFWRADMTYGTEPGAFEVFVGDSSEAALSASFRLAR